MTKQKLFIDMDATIVHSHKQYCKVYNILYRDHSDFKPADYTKIKYYNMTCQCPLEKNPLNIFEHELFFADLEFINHNTYEVLKELNEEYQLIIATIGNHLNLAHKSLWIERNLPFIKDYVLLNNDGCKMNKSLINMEGAIFIDDIVSNLDSSNARHKVLFGKKFDWNREWTIFDGYWCSDWSEVKRLLL